MSSPISHILYCTVCSYTHGPLSSGNKHLATQTPRFHHWIIHCYTHTHHIYTSNDAHMRIHIHSSSSTDTNRHTRRWTHTRRCSRTQNKHTQGFGVLVSICGEAILSLWLSPSLTAPLRGGSYCGHETHCCCCCSLCVCVWIRASVCICMCASLLM